MDGQESSVSENSFGIEFLLMLSITTDLLVKRLFPSFVVLSY